MTWLWGFFFGVMTYAGADSYNAEEEKTSDSNAFSLATVDCVYHGPEGFIRFTASEDIFAVKPEYVQRDTAGRSMYLEYLSALDAPQ